MRGLFLRRSQHEIECVSHEIHEGVEFVGLTRNGSVFLNDGIGKNRGISSDASTGTLFPIGFAIDSSHGSIGAVDAMRLIEGVTMGLQNILSVFSLVYSGGQG